MASVSIDHVISLTVIVAIMLFAFSFFSQHFSSAIFYQRYQQVVIKAEDLLNTILLTPGFPSNWGQSNSTPLAFGLQDPEAKGYTLSPFSLMRLLSSSGDLVYYNRTGKWYSNVSWGVGGSYFLLPTSDCINYTTASTLLGVNQAFGFQFSAVPTLNITISEVQQQPLKLKIEVRGPGQSTPQAGIEYTLFWTTGKQGSYPLFNVTSGNAITNSIGVAYLEFSDDPYIGVRKNQTAYTIIVSANLAGLHGVGYKSRDVITKAGNIIPFIDNYENGTVLLAHKWGKNDPEGSQSALHFNSTFYIQTDDFGFIETEIEDSAGVVNYGLGKPYHQIQIPTQYRGFLMVTYTTGNEYGAVIMPWGLSTLGVGITFGDPPSNNEWVATTVRHVTVGEISYQVKLALWSLSYG